MNTPSKYTKDRDYIYLIHKKGTCEVCGVSNRRKDEDGFVIGKVRLEVHHIDENRENNDPSNLMTLCTSCHRKKHE